jgi:AcrR family transcriptional regulator
MEAARRTRKGEARRREILETFHDVLAEEGLEGASINRVASRMGINPSLIMHYFPTKEEMVCALVEHILSRYEETFLPRLRAVADPEERMRAAAEVLFGPEWPGLVNEGVFYACYSLSFRNPRVRESFRGMYSRLREVLAEEIGALVDACVIAGGDAGNIADLVIILLEGYDFYRGVMGGDERREELGRYLKATLLAFLAP